ncbi:acriflavin resistance protein [Spirochaetia bacterium]|nr:acriflavin resistance protein [Spirochaetia bacterium]
MKLPLNKLPEISLPRITVETNYLGLGAEEIRLSVTIPVEDALAPVKGLEKIKSVSRDGSSLIILDFKWGTILSGAAINVREAIDAVYPNLPEGVDKPTVITGDTNNEAQIIIAASSKKNDVYFERDFCEYELRNRLRRIDGVGSIILTGGNKKQINIKVNLERAIERNIDIATLADIIASETVEMPAGNAKEGNMELVILSSGKPKNIMDLSELVISSGSSPLYLADIAKIEEAPAKKKSIFVYNGKEQTALEIYRRPGANPIEVTNDIKNVIKDINNLFFNDIEVSIVHDTTPETVNDLTSLVTSILLGAFAVVIILVLFLCTIKNSLLTVLSIPFSAAVSFAFLFVCGKTINSMSLSGIALGIGLVTDTSVIIIDLLFKHMIKNKAVPSSEEIADITASVSASSFGGTATTIVIFIPIIFLPGALGELFGDLSIALIASVFCGWFFSQFMLPVFFKLSARLDTFVIRNNKIDRYYRGLLFFSIRKYKTVTIMALLFFSFGGLFFTARPLMFVPKRSASEIDVVVSYPSGTKQDYIANESRYINKELLKVKGIKTIFCRAGSENDDINRRSMPEYRAENAIFRCVLKHKEKQEQIISNINHVLTEVVPNTRFSIGYPAIPIENILGLSSSSVLLIKSDNRYDLEKRVVQINSDVKKLIADNDVLVNIRPLEKRPELKIFPNREIESIIGVNAKNIAMAVGSTTEGLVASTIEIDGKPINIRVIGANENESEQIKKQIESIPVILPENNHLYMGTIGNITKTDSNQVLLRVDRSDALYIELTNNNQTNKNYTEKIIENVLKENKFVSRIDESAFSVYKTSIIITVILVVLLLYMTMGAQFESFKLPVVFMITIPFAISGAGPLLSLFNVSLDSGSILGIIVLFGLVVNNGIVLYETITTKILGQNNIAGTIYICAVERFKPVVATTLTSIIVLIPLIISTTGSTERSMSVAMFGGSIAAMLFNLFILPSIYIYYFQRQENEK